MDTGTFIKDMVLTAWSNKVAQATQLFDALVDGPVNREVISGGNKIIYIIGHLIVASDKLFEVMNLGERLYPELDAFFFTAQNPDHEYPSYALLRQRWGIVNQELARYFRLLSLDEWMSKQYIVSEADFALDPSRNRLNTLISRTGHLSYHLGQLALVKHMHHESHEGNIQTDCDYI